MNTPLYIFDLDGTLALIDHRRHFVEGPRKKDWDAFFAACVNDKPNVPVIRTLRMLVMTGAEIWIWSGRNDKVGPESRIWLRHNVHDIGANFYLRMRKDGDRQDDVTLKQSWLLEMSPSDRDRLVAVFDDRQRVVDMWRAHGITCFQVAPGYF
jgi:hypothetical protein